LYSGILGELWVGHGQNDVKMWTALYWSRKRSNDGDIPRGLIRTVAYQHATWGPLQLASQSVSQPASQPPSQSVSQSASQPPSQSVS